MAKIVDSISENVGQNSTERGKGWWGLWGKKIEKFKSRGNKWRQKCVCLCLHIVSNLTVMFPDMAVVICSS